MVQFSGSTILGRPTRPGSTPPSATGRSGSSRIPCRRRRSPPSGNGPTARRRAPTTDLAGGAGIRARPRFPTGGRLRGGCPETSRPAVADLQVELGGARGSTFPPASRVSIHSMEYCHNVRERTCPWPDYSQLLTCPRLLTFSARFCTPLLRLATPLPVVYLAGCLGDSTPCSELDDWLQDQEVAGSNPVSPTPQRPGNPGRLCFHDTASFAAIPATCFPCARAMARSFAVGWRSPFGPEIVLAP